MQGIILKVSLLLYLLQDLRLAAVCKGNGEVEGLHRGWGSPAPQACMGLKGQPLLWDSSVPWCSRAAPWLSPLPNHEQKKKEGSPEVVFRVCAEVFNRGSIQVCSGLLYKKTWPQEYESMFSRGTGKSFKRLTLLCKEISSSPQAEGRVKPDD